MYQLSKMTAFSRLLLVGVYLTALIPITALASSPQSPLSKLVDLYPLELWLIVWLIIWVGCILLGTITAAQIESPVDKKILASGAPLIRAKVVMSLFLSVLGGLLLATEKKWKIPSLELCIWSGVLAGIAPTFVLTCLEMLPQKLREKFGVKEDV